MDGMRATVLAVSSACLPSRVRFEFADALESEGRVWLVWDGMQPRPWKPPAIGARADVPSASMWSLMF